MCEQISQAPDTIRRYIKRLDEASQALLDSLEAVEGTGAYIPPMDILDILHDLNGAASTVESLVLKVDDSLEYRGGDY